MYVRHLHLTCVKCTYRANTKIYVCTSWYKSQSVSPVWSEGTLQTDRLDWHGSESQSGTLVVAVTNKRRNHNNNGSLIVEHFWLVEAPVYACVWINVTTTTESRKKHEWLWCKLHCCRCIFWPTPILACKTVLVNVNFNNFLKKVQNLID